MKYLFVLGRNVELSIAELKSFFRKSKMEFNQIGLTGNGLLVETSGMLREKSIDGLGGTISIGEVLVEGDLDKIAGFLENETLYKVTGNKLNYILFNFKGENFEGISESLKRKFKEEKLKATEKKLSGNIKMQSGESIGNVSSKLIDEQYFVFENCFGRIIQKSNYEEIEERDMKKPARRNELSISPRLAKILINLSEVPDEGILLDPFCGIGVVMEEALLQGMKVTGIDKDKSAIGNAEKNLKWFKFSKKDYNLIHGDSTRVNPGKTNGIATEPDFGDLRKVSPSEGEAKKTIGGFENLMIKLLNNQKKHLEQGSRIAFTAPFISTGKKKQRIGCNFKKIADSSGLEIVNEPIPEFREDSIVGRSIVVMR